MSQTPTLSAQAQTEMGRASAPAVATIGDPAPLGLAGFGLTTLILSIVNAGWFGTGGGQGTNAAIVPLTASPLSMSATYAVLAQILAAY